MKPTFFTTLALLSAETMGHTMFTHFHTGGKADTSCVRRPPNTNPILDLSAVAMACNVGSDVGGKVSGKCNVKAGDSIGFEWRTDPGIAAKDYPLKSTPQGRTPIGVIDDSHKGPCAVYLKKVDNAATAQGSGGGWFKIFEQTLVNGVFCTDILRLANAIQQVTLPKTIENGDYLVRTEILTLNNAGARSIGGAEEPQFYVGCAQITVTGGTGSGKPTTVSIPGYVTKNTPGMLFDIWNSPSGQFTNYPSFGPPVFKDVESSDNFAPDPPSVSSTSSRSVAPTTSTRVATTSKPTTIPTPTTLKTSTIVAIPTTTTSTTPITKPTTTTSTTTSATEPTKGPSNPGKDDDPDYHPNPWWGWPPRGKPYWPKHYGWYGGRWWGRPKGRGY